MQNPPSLATTIFTRTNIEDAGARSAGTRQYPAMIYVVRCALPSRSRARAMHSQISGLLCVVLWLFVDAHRCGPRLCASVMNNDDYLWRTAVGDDTVHYYI